MSQGEENASPKMIDEAARRVLVAECDMTVDADRLREALRAHYQRGCRDMFSLVKAGRRFVHERQSGLA